MGLRKRGVHGVRGVFDPAPAEEMRGDLGTAGDAYEDEGRVAPPVGVCEADSGNWTWALECVGYGVVKEEDDGAAYPAEVDGGANPAGCVGECVGGVMGGVTRLGVAGTDTSSLSTVLFSM